MSEIQKRNTLLIQQYNYIDQNIVCSNRYKEHIQYFFNYLEKESYSLNFNGFVSYYNFLNKKWKEGVFKTTTFNVRLCASKKSIRFLFESSPYSEDMAKEFRLDKVLSSYKCKKTESRFVSKDKYLSPAEIREFINECTDITISLLVEFIFKTACRISEVTSILLSDINKVNDHYEITIRGKGGKTRVIPTSIELIDRIKKYFNSKKWLFEHEYLEEIRPYNPVSLTNRFNEHVQKILKKGMKIRCHTLRHSALTYLLEKSKNIKKVSLLAGHSTSAITADLYIHSKFEYDELKGYFEDFYHNSVIN